VLRSSGEVLSASDLATVQGQLGMSYMIRLGLFVGIVFLMTTKPVAGPTALLVVVVAGALGFLAGLPARRRGPARA
jgi:hypothetical protein